MVATWAKHYSEKHFRKPGGGVSPSVAVALVPTRGRPLSGSACQCAWPQRDCGSRCCSYYLRQPPRGQRKTRRWCGTVSCGGAPVLYSAAGRALRTPRGRVARRPGTMVPGSQSIHVTGCCPAPAAEALVSALHEAASAGVPPPPAAPPTGVAACGLRVSGDWRAYAGDLRREYWRSPSRTAVAVAFCTLGVVVRLVGSVALIAAATHQPACCGSRVGAASDPFMLAVVVLQSASLPFSVCTVLMLRPLGRVAWVASASLLLLSDTVQHFAVFRRVVSVGILAAVIAASPAVAARAVMRGAKPVDALAVSMELLRAGVNIATLVASERYAVFPCLRSQTWCAQALRGLPTDLFASASFPPSGVLSSCPNATAAGTAAAAVVESVCFYATASGACRGPSACKCWCLWDTWGGQ